MKISAALLVSGFAGGSLGAAVKARDGPSANKVEPLEAKFFKDLDAKRVKITYGPYNVPGIDDPTTHGMTTFVNMNALMPCQDCLLTGTVPDLIFEDGSTANADKGMWLHHIGLGNWNRADVVCTSWPERFLSNGNERSNVDLTLGGTRKVGYYFGPNDRIMLATELMNESELSRTVYLTIEWEYLAGIPDGFDLDVPIWLDVKGDCPSQAGPLVPKADVFNATRESPWSPNFTGDLYLMTSHVHDGNIHQEVFLDGKMVCDSVANYGESAGYISHVGMYGHEMEHEHGGDDDEEEGEEEGEPGSEHDHGSDDHIAHISSTTSCQNLGKIGPDSKLTLTSFYDMTKHPAMMGHDGDLEPIMAIEWMHMALSPEDEAMKQVLASKGPDRRMIMRRFAERSRKGLRFL